MLRTIVAIISRQTILANTSVAFTLENATSSSGLNGKECVFTTDYNGEEQNTAVTKFTVKTGKAFEEQGLTYANYRVELYRGIA